MDPIRVLTAAVLALAAGLAQALTLVPYSEQALAAAQAAGRPLAVHFHADWCPTCRAQAKAFEALKSDPALDLTVFVADYDNEQVLKRRLKVRAQSTLIVFHGDAERARVVGETRPQQLKAALQEAR